MIFNGKNIFTVTIIVTILTVLSIWLFGLGQHRTIFINSILSTSILSIAFFLFITIGLYRGIKLKDEVDIFRRISKNKFPNLSEGIGHGIEIPEMGDGIVGILIGILAWVVISIALLVFIWLVGSVLWTMIIVFITMLYWIFFHALRLVFKNSNVCKNNIIASIIYGLSYTLLYNCWIYAILFATHYVVN